MCLKIRCDGESEKFCKNFWELNKALIIHHHPRSLADADAADAACLPPPLTFFPLPPFPPPLPCFHCVRRSRGRSSSSSSSSSCATCWGRPFIRDTIRGAVSRIHPGPGPACRHDSVWVSQCIGVRWGFQSGTGTGRDGSIGRSVLLRWAAPRAAPRGGGCFLKMR